ncbi:phosphonate metabolism protein/1,5-bisphosphokinase (PRPP-forming) PhnN [Pseudomonas argentinensis]|uniref:Ribose 1,5-bisphosphate phosphokinase PhnN n=2 Tax=Phytopseudomonas argentinensis TaxID=289370 RepID=A0A1I3H3H4_9GAMM|nr:phosphonate metabolism protein/1,5-bisphosphokinase (PRPP-forming) PhnN [Pseudomonas argentinensis]KAB0548698.1 phosphonate metabolism protein/1,5-bisphosphokinase (PRPP-forming) PhnN [Pseudomonas argentinensis]SFI30090.1 ribose 1,5-bisphosphokinase [Pseudomonas argentinensis]
MTQGMLIYLMGPSGSGKDSVLAALERRLENRRCRIARRIVTRGADLGGEEAIAVSFQAFEARESAGGFAMSWRANGLAYGIGLEIDTWLADGYLVVVNGSRAYLDEARRRYPQLEAVLLEVEPAVLRSRLLSRARESAAQIDARMARSAHFADRRGSATEGVLHIDNSGPLERAVESMLRLIDSLPGPQEGRSPGAG